VVHLFSGYLLVYTRTGPKKHSVSKLAQSRPHRSDLIRSQPSGDHFLSLLPGWKAFANQCLPLVRHVDQMTSPILFRLKPEPSFHTHPLDVSAERGLVHLEQLGQFRGADAFPISDRHEDGELAGLQSGTRQCSVIDRGNHAIELAHAKPDAFPFDSFSFLV